MTRAAQTLDRAGIAERIPHSGSMCLLDRLERWDAESIQCSTRTHALPDCDLVVILDVLHYVNIEAQDGVLQRVRDALRRGGNPNARLLLRVGDASSKRGFAISQWVDRTVTRIRGHKVSPTWGRPLSEWMAVLQRLGFRVQSIPMSEGTPFANVLLVADLEPPA